jgi:putative Holliday junction resolvase
MVTDHPAVIIGLDLGRVRTGIARADLSETLATPVATVDTEPVSTLHRRILAALQPLRISRLIAGLPLNQHGGENESTGFVRSICAVLEDSFGLEIEFVDERFSTREMQTRLKEGGGGQRDRREGIDAWAAMSILQSFLDSSR